MLLLLLGPIATALVAYHGNVTMTVGDSQNLIYDKPYTRCAPYALGLLCGILLANKMEWFKSMSPLAGISSLIISAGGIITVMYITAAFNWSSNKPNWSTDTQFVYEALWYVCVRACVRACVFAFESEPSIPPPPPPFLFLFESRSPPFFFGSHMHLLTLSGCLSPPLSLFSICCVVFPPHSRPVWAVFLCWLSKSHRHSPQSQLEHASLSATTLTSTPFSSLCLCLCLLSL